jgi:hypothetical protein
MANPQSSASSFTAKEPVFNSGPDVESQQAHNDPPHWFLVLHPSGVTDAVLNYTYPGQGTPESPYVVDFLPDDRSNPLKYSQTKKWVITMLQAVATLAVTFVSTAYSGGVAEIVRYFNVSTIVAILGISLFVLGFAIGPLLWAPLSGMLSPELGRWKIIGTTLLTGHDGQNSTGDRLCSSSPTLAWWPSALAPPALRTSTHSSFCASSPARSAHRR